MGGSPIISILYLIILKKVLSEEEKGFNQTVLYGRDVSIEDIVSTAKRNDGGTSVVVIKHKI
jgi:DNA polymerase-3 subunit delta